MVAPLVVAAIISGLGAAIKHRQEQKQLEARVGARNQVLADTMALNRPIAEESRGMFTDRLASGAPDMAAETAARDRRSAFMADATDVDLGIPVAGSAPESVRSEIAQTMLRALNSGRDQAQALGKIGAHGDLWSGQGVMNRQLANNLSLNANRASGNLAILPSLQELADVGSIKPRFPIGDIMMGVGNAYGSYAGANGGGIFG